MIPALARLAACCLLGVAGWVAGVYLLLAVVVDVWTP